MITPLDKAVKFYELKDKVRNLLVQLPSEYPDVDQLERRVMDLISEINAIDATPDKVAAIGEEGK